MNTPAVTPIISIDNNREMKARLLVCQCVNNPFSLHTTHADAAATPIQADRLMPAGRMQNISNMAPNANQYF